MSKQPFICHCGFNTMDTKKALEHSREHEMNENKLSREDVLKWINQRIKSLSTRLESSQNMGWHDKVVVIEHELSFWKAIKSLLTPLPEANLNELVEKWAKELQNAFKDGSLSGLTFCKYFIRGVTKAHDELKEGK